MHYSTVFLVCIRIAPRKTSVGPVNFPWNWSYFHKTPVKSRIFLCELDELGWSLAMMGGYSAIFKSLFLNNRHVDLETVDGCRQKDGFKSYIHCCASY